MTTKSELNTGTICKALAYAIVVIGRIVLLPLTRSWLGKEDHGRSARAGTAGEDVLLITGYRQLTGERQRCFVDAVNWRERINFNRLREQRGNGKTPNTVGGREMTFAG
jgi:hypothetical protein